jgi:DNA-binding CsgD family transcriptional regulator
VARGRAPGRPVRGAAGVSALRISVPGRPIELILDVDPWSELTPTQRRVAEAILAHRGSRTAVARELGLSVQTVQGMVRRIRARGVRLPSGAGRGPDLRPRKGLRPACGATMPRSGTVCARGAGHAGGCRSMRAVQAERLAQSRQERTGRRVA